MWGQPGNGVLWNCKLYSIYLTKWGAFLRDYDGESNGKWSSFGTFFTDLRVSPT